MSIQVDSGSTRELDREVEQRIQGIERMLATEGRGADERLDAPPAQSASETGAETAAAIVDRREFIRSTAAVVGTAAVAGTLQMFQARRAHATLAQHYRVSSPYGDPIPTVDEATGLPLIGLPPGFRYWSHGWTSDLIFPGLAGGPVVPALHDGMAVLRKIGPLAILCRNHEVNVPSTSFVAGSLQYSPAAGGGNTNMIFDTSRRKWIATWPTLAGTIRNCGGGVTDHSSWLSCEETNVVTSGPDGRSYTHGWVFDVPAIGVSDGKPIKAMGRRSHEACAVDPRTGYVYLTEDAAPGGVYRFKPNRTRPWERPYSSGGRLEVLKIAGKPDAVLTGKNPVGSLPKEIAYPAAVGEPLDIEWVRIDDPENLEHATNYEQGDGGRDLSAAGRCLVRRR